MFVTLWLLYGVAFAGDVVQGANLLGMGGVGVAAPSDNAAVTLNPGLIPLRKRYDVHAHLRYGPTAGLQWAATAVDARTSSDVMAGAAYSGDRFDPALTNADLPAWSLAGEPIENRKRFHDLAFALAIPMAQRRIGAGLAGNVTWFNHDQQGQGRRFEMHAGLGASITKSWTVGASARNFLPLDREDRPLQLLAGTRFEDLENVAFEVNVSRAWVTSGSTQLVFDTAAAQAPERPSALSVIGGVEKVVKNAQVRAGGGWDGPRNRPILTFGLGLTDTSGGIEYGLLVPLVADLDFASTVHQISVRFGAPAEIEEPQ